MLDTAIAWWSDASFTKKLATIVAGAALLRIVWALLIPISPVSDSFIYYQTAQNIAFKGFYGLDPDRPFSYWPVGASAVYALAFRIFGDNALAPVLANLLMGLLLITTTAYLARRWCGQSIALIAAALIAVWPTFILYTTVYASEAIFAVAVNAALLLWRPSQKQSFAIQIAAGAMFGAAALIRPVALLIPILLAVASVLKAGDPARIAARLLVVAAAMAIVIAPWSVRNTAAHGEFVLISTNGGPVLWMGNNPQSNGGYMQPPARVRGLSEVERSAILKKEAQSYILSHPGRTIFMFFKKLINTHRSETIAVHWNEPSITERFGQRALLPLKAGTQAFWLAVLGLALVGVAKQIRTSFTSTTIQQKLAALAFPPLLVWGYYAGVHAVVISQDRYHLQSAPFIAMLAAIGICAAFSAWRQNKNAKLKGH